MSLEIDPRWAWAAYQPDARRPWNLRWAGHLYRRAGFGGAWPELQQALTDGPQQAIDRLLHRNAETAAFDREYDQYEAAGGDAESANSEVLRGWWLRRMLLSPFPLQEKMTLFWLNYFSARNVGPRAAAMMRRHVRLLRGHALGRFSELLPAVMRDPAVLAALNGGENVHPTADAPLARQLLEQYTLGAGVATPGDLADTGRAFSGRFVFHGQLHESPSAQTQAIKTVLGKSGPLGGDDVVALLLKSPATPRTVVRKLYRWLVSETDPPDDRLLAPLAEMLAEDYSIARVVETMLRSNLFFSPSAYRQRIKSPAEFALGIVRPLGRLLPTSQLGNDLIGLGQDLYQPPTLAGWEGGPTWVHQAALVARSNLAAALLAETGPYGEKLDPQGLAAKYGATSPSAASRLLLDVFLQGDLEPAVAEDWLRGSDRSLRSAVHALVTLPEFHLA
jgi:uncharacterized protein (DUF1800 family)